MKTKTLLIAAVMFFGISVAAFAQATYTIGSIPVTTVVRSGITEKTGDITFTTIPTTGATVTGTISITYTSPVTLNGTVVVVQDLTDPNAPNTPTPGAPTLSADGYTVNFTVSPYFPAASAARYYGFRITGVRVRVAGNPGAAPLFASITTTGNGFVAGQDQVRVVNATAAGISSFTAGTAVFNALTGFDYPGGTVHDQLVNLTATEGFAFVWGVTQASDPTQSPAGGAVMVKISTTSTIPDGIRVSFPTNDASGNFTICSYFGDLSTGVYANWVPGSTPAIYYKVTTDTNQIAVENLVIPVVVHVDAPTTSVYSTATQIKASISLAPIESELGTYYYLFIPRYVEEDVAAAASLISFAAAFDRTVMMIPYATNAVGYDTGIAIANTTLDPGYAVTGMGAPLQQTGKITYYFFPNSGGPNDGDMFSVDTTAGGMPTDPLVAGKLAPGKSYVHLLSEFLAAAGSTDTFSGYIIVVCDFTNAHGEYFISNFDNFTHGALMLVMDSENRGLDIPEVYVH